MRRTVPLPDEAVELLRAWPIPLDPPTAYYFPTGAAG